MMYPEVVAKLSQLKPFDFARALNIGYPEVVAKISELNPFDLRKALSIGYPEIVLKLSQLDLFELMKILSIGARIGVRIDIGLREFQPPRHYVRSRGAFHELPLQQKRYVLKMAGRVSGSSSRRTTAASGGEDGSVGGG